MYMYVCLFSSLACTVHVACFMENCGSTLDSIHVQSTCRTM